HVLSGRAAALGQQSSELLPCLGETVQVPTMQGDLHDQALDPGIDQGIADRTSKYFLGPIQLSLLTQERGQPVGEEGTLAVCQPQLPTAPQTLCVHIGRLLEAAVLTEPGSQVDQSTNLHLGMAVFPGDLDALGKLCGIGLVVLTDHCRAESDEGVGLAVSVPDPASQLQGPARGTTPLFQMATHHQGRSQGGADGCVEGMT